MSVLVTGCAGFIGSNLTEALLEKGHEVTGMDSFDAYYDVAIKKRNMEAFRSNRSFALIKGSILDKDSLSKVPRDTEVVFHHAAIAGVRSSISDPLKYGLNNGTGTLSLLERLSGVKRFIYASSSSVYGEVPEERLPVREDYPADPVSPYAASKLAGERWCEMYSRIHGMKIVILRYFTVYGPRQRPDEAICRFISRISGGQDIEVYGDGEQTRDFTYVVDVVRANLLSLDSGNGTYNIGSGESVSVNRLVQVIKDAIGREVRARHVGKQKGDVRHTLADITKARKGLGYSPEYGIEKGIREYVRWLG